MQPLLLPHRASAMASSSSTNPEACGNHGSSLGESWSCTPVISEGGQNLEDLMIQENYHKVENSSAEKVDRMISKDGQNMDSEKAEGGKCMYLLYVGSTIITCIYLLLLSF